ncbi:hypothetical protein ACMFMG_000195 [Clarireedia jacksonii]
MNTSEEVIRLLEENQKLRSELHDANLRLAASAHKEYQVPDGSIREDYQKLCSAIERWIDYVSEDDSSESFRSRYEDVVRKEEKNRKEEKDQTLKNLGIHYDRPNLSDPTLSWLRGLDMLHYYILSLVIGKYIFWILIRRYPLGTTELQRMTFTSIQDEMLNMGKAKSRKNQWRSDTLRALCASKQFQAEQETRLTGIWKELQTELSCWLSDSNILKHQGRLKRDIFDPAVKVHMDMQCSVQQYEVVSAPVGGRITSSFTRHDECTETVKEITNWKMRTRESTDVDDLCIYPGIITYDAAGEVKSNLVRPVMVVYKRTPLPSSARHSNESPARSQSQPSNSPSKEPQDAKARGPVTSSRGLASSNRKTSDSGRSSEPSLMSRPSSHDTNVASPRNQQSENYHYATSIEQQRQRSASYSGNSHLSYSSETQRSLPHGNGILDESGETIKSTH